MSVITIHLTKSHIILHKGELGVWFLKHCPKECTQECTWQGRRGKLYNNPRVPQKRPESHQNCERLQPGGLSPEIKVSTLCHLATCQAVELHSAIKAIKVMFDLHIFSFASSLSHIWVMNPYPHHGDTTNPYNCIWFHAFSLTIRQVCHSSIILWVPIIA
jgi:hypothetical protein